MPILKPDDLIDQARILASARAGARGPPRQVDLRRAMSSAYYAVFHELLTAMADLCVGATLRRTARYVLAYRSIDHSQARDLCRELGKATPGQKHRRYLPGPGVSQDLRDFGLEFVRLQEERHKADYDPRPRFATAEAEAVVEQASAALRAFRALARNERDLFLTLLAFPPR